MLRETEEERQKGKTKKRITENKRLHPNSAEFDRSVVHAFIRVQTWGEDISILDAGV